MVADREVAGKEVVAESALSMEGVTRTMEQMMTRGAAIALMVRPIPIMMGETVGTDPSRRHAPPGAAPVTW